MRLCTAQTWLSGVLWFLAASACAQAYKQGEWIPGRATFYGGTDALIDAYKERGIESFGIIEHGSCGYTLSDGSLPYARDMYAALADTNFDYPGSCGRCYEVRCKSGLVQDQGSPVSIEQFYYLAKVDSTVKDTYGRSFPGNPKESEKQQYVNCWDDAASIIVRIGDSCPCQQKKPDGSTQPQFWCCGGANHMDLSYWAFEKLAHPVYGVIGIEYRPVNCQSKQPLDPVPGFVSNMIYKDDLGSGWGWRPYMSKNTQIQASGEGLDGSTATCLTASKDGAVVFVVRDGYKPGYQQFSKASHLQFWIKSNTKSNDPYASSTPPGQPPALKVFLMSDEKNLWCGQEVMLNQQNWVEQKGPYFKYSLPLSLFRCDESSSAKSLANINRIDFMNVDERDADFCIDDMVLIGSKQSSGNTAPAPPTAPPTAPAPAPSPPPSAQTSSSQQQQQQQSPSPSSPSAPDAASTSPTQQQQAAVQEEKSEGSAQPKPPTAKPKAKQAAAKSNPAAKQKASKPQPKPAAAAAAGGGGGAAAATATATAQSKKKPGGQQGKQKPQTNAGRDAAAEQQQQQGAAQQGNKPKAQPKQAANAANSAATQRKARQNNSKKPPAKKAAAAVSNAQQPVTPVGQPKAKAAAAAAEARAARANRKQQPEQTAAAVDDAEQAAVQPGQQQQQAKNPPAKQQPK